MGYLATQASTIAKQALINQGCYGEIVTEEPSSEPDVCTYTGFSNSNLTDGNYPNTNFTAKTTQSITEVTRITPMIAGDQYDINTMASVYGTASGVSVNYIIDGNG